MSNEDLTIERALDIIRRAAGVGPLHYPDEADVQREPSMYAKVAAQAETLATTPRSAEDEARRALEASEMGKSAAGELAYIAEELRRTADTIQLLQHLKAGPLELTEMCRPKLTGIEGSL